MNKLDRRSALAIGLAAASAAIVKPAASQTMDPLAGKDTTPWPGVVVRAYGESPSLIPGFNGEFGRLPSNEARKRLVFGAGP